MRFVYRFFFLALISILFFECQREVSYIGTADPGQTLLPNPISANLQGNVLDENGQPAANVVIKVGSEMAATDTKGYFRINNAPLDKNASLVTAEKTGYFTAYRTFGATSGTNQVVIKLTKKNLGGTINGVAGGDVSLNNGTKISLPANGIVKASDNSNYTGAINVYAAYIDPTSADILDKVPGSFMANNKDGKRVLLSSYGMMAVELESSAGEKLQIKPGNTATLTSPIPSLAQSSAPATISLWYVDESTGLWKEEGTATKQGNNYIGTVKHFTYWNCDIQVQTVMLTATFKTANGQPLVNASIVIKPTTGNYYGTAHGYTDSLGQMNGPVPANMNLVLQVMDGCGGSIYSQNIGPYAENMNLGTISIPSTVAAIVTVKGKLTNCTNGNVTKGYAVVSIDNWVHYAKADANGNFSTNFSLCSTNGKSAQVLGVDETTLQQGNVSTVAVVTPITDAGTIAACGTVSTQFLNYTIDNTSYTVLDSDSLTAFTSGQATQLSTYINGMQIGSGGIGIWFKFDHTAPAAGTYGVYSLGFNTQNSVANLIQPFNVVITNFPQSAGQFYQGSFTGQYKDGSNVTHNITCSFKVRRTF